MNQDGTVKRDSSTTPDGMLLAEFGKLWAEADAIWERHQNAPAFHGYVSSDYQSVYEALVPLRGSVVSVLEWGSGLGIVTIMASLMGFDAYGIEAEPELVRYAEEFAQKYNANAQFAQGSFIPDDFEWDLANGDDAQRTIIDLASSYDELEMELRDFDLVYAYPWPEEHTLFHNIMRQCGRRGSLLLTYDVREGLQLARVDDR